MFPDFSIDKLILDYALASITGFAFI